MLPKITLSSLVLFLIFGHYTYAQKKILIPYNTTDTIRVPYDKSINIVLSGVNTLDFEYVVEIEAVFPQPKLPQINRTPFPGAGVLGAAACQARETATANDLFKKRIIVYGGNDLKQWHQKYVQNITCTDYIHFLDSEIGDDISKFGHHTIDSGKLIKSLSKTNSGGGLKIKVHALGHKTQIPTNPNNTKLPLSDGETQLVAEHTKSRIIFLEFDRPKGIELSFGPYISTLKHQAFTKQKSTTDPNQQVIGLEENDDIRYGVAANWQASLLKSNKLLATWGVAYTPQGKIDDQIAGLLGLSLRTFSGAVFFNFGLGIGNQTKLADGYKLGESVIGQNEEIPLTTELNADAFFSLSFKFK